jgi:hypothetical protein
MRARMAIAVDATAPPAFVDVILAQASMHTLGVESGRSVFIPGANDVQRSVTHICLDQPSCMTSQQ